MQNSFSKPGNGPDAHLWKEHAKGLHGFVPDMPRDCMALCQTCQDLQAGSDRALHRCGQVMWKKAAPYNFKCRKVVQLPGNDLTTPLTHGSVALHMHAWQFPPTSSDRKRVMHSSSACLGRTCGCTRNIYEFALRSVLDAEGNVQSCQLLLLLQAASAAERQWRCVNCAQVKSP